MSSAQGNKLLPTNCSRSFPTLVKSPRSNISNEKEMESEERRDEEKKFVGVDEINKIFLSPFLRST